MQTENIVRILTICSLAGLLGAVGLRLTFRSVVESLKGCRLVLIVVSNFVVVPLLTMAIVRLFKIPQQIAIGMILLGVAPFAPVVPVFARLARADLALAAGLTSFFPILSAFFTPVVLAVSLELLAGVGLVRFDLLGVLLTLGATITVPLVLGVVIRHIAPVFAQRLLRPMEVASEAAGALSLVFVTVTQFKSIVETGYVSLLGMVLAFELSLALGWWIGRPLRTEGPKEQLHAKGSRRVIALGTSNRNIALALLVALQSFPGTPVVSAVVANGLALIFLGLLHVAWWRLAPRAGKSCSETMC